MSHVVSSQDSGTIRFLEIIWAIRSSSTPVGFEEDSCHIRDESIMILCGCKQEFMLIYGKIRVSDTRRYPTGCIPRYPWY